MVSSGKPKTATLTMFAKLNYLLSCSHVRSNKPHSVNQRKMEKSVWGILDIPIGCWEYPL